jgi:hypothetical protein
MSGIHTTIAEAVKDALNAASLSQSFTATRVYVPELELRDTEDAIVVRVWPAPEGRVTTLGKGTRSARHREYPVYVCVLRKCDVDTNATVDAYAYLLEEIEDNFLGDQLTGYTSAVCIVAEEVALFTWENMRQLRQYTGVTKLIFRRIS